MTAQTSGTAAADSDAVATRDDNPGEGLDGGPQSGTTTVRIFNRTKPLVRAHQREGESTGEAIDRVLRDVPTDTRVDQDRRRVAAYIRDHLIPDFGDQDEITAGEEIWQELAALQFPHSPDTVDPTAVIVDHTILTLLVAPSPRTGSPADAARTEARRLMARLLHVRPAQHRRHVVAPTQAMLLATAQQPTAARHVRDIGAIEEEPFTGDAVLMMGQRFDPQINPTMLHVLCTALPSERHPTGRPVLTAVPDLYSSYRQHVRIRAVAVAAESQRSW